MIFPKKSLKSNLNLYTTLANAKKSRITERQFSIKLEKHYFGLIFLPFANKIIHDYFKTVSYYKFMAHFVPFYPVFFKKSGSVTF